MKNLPAKARAFVIFTYCLGGAAALALAFLAGPLRLLHLTHRMTPVQFSFEVALFAVFSILASGHKIHVVRRKDNDDAGSISLGFAIIFTALLRFGPVGAVGVGLISTLSSCLFKFGKEDASQSEGGWLSSLGAWFHVKRHPWFQLFFNVAVNLSATTCASLLFLVLNHGTLAIKSAQSLPALILTTLLFFFGNTGMVATVLALCTGKRAWDVWNESFLGTFLGFFLGAFLSTFFSIVLGDQLALSMLCTVPVAIVTYMAYKRDTDRATQLAERTQKLAERTQKLADSYFGIINSLALAIDAKDRYTHQHVTRVQRYAVAVAGKYGLKGDDLTAIETSALLHDIGKLGVPEYVLLKPGKLTDEEFAKIKEHPRIGADILDSVTFPWPVLPGVKYHHEKWDGSGYPEGLKGEDIPLQGRILAVADVYDALTSNRSYRNAWNHEKACNTIRDDAGKHFDPQVVDAFLGVIDEVVAQMAAEGCGPLLSSEEQQAASVQAAENEAVGFVPGGVAGATPGADNHNGNAALAPPSGTVSGVNNAPVLTPKAHKAARDIQRASSELWALYEVSQTLSSSLGLQETIEILARKLAAIHPPGTACVFLLRDDNGQEGDLVTRLRVRAAIGVNHEFFENSQTNNVDSQSVQVARKRVTYRGVFDPEDIMPRSIQTTPFEELRAAVIAPIIHQQEVLGTINLYHPDADAFGAHDQQLLEMIAERAAMALYNGLLFDRTRSSAMTDALTGLANSRHLTESVQERCRASAEQVNPRPFALLCLDLDSFKPINDNFGHLKGDQVLKDLAQILRDCVWKKDIVARYGGDEFLIVLDDAGAIEAREVAEKIQNAVVGYDPGLNHPKLGVLRLGVSIGYACFPHDGGDVPTLLSVADQLMYRDKTERKLGRLADTHAPASAPPTATDAAVLAAPLLTSGDRARTFGNAALAPVAASLPQAMGRPTLVLVSEPVNDDETEEALLSPESHAPAPSPLHLV